MLMMIIIIIIIIIIMGLTTKVQVSYTECYIVRYCNAC